MIRRRKPSAIREAEGVRGHHRPLIPDLQGEGRPLADEHLSPEARSTFYKAVRAMPAGIYCEADTAALEVWATYLHEYRACAAEIAVTGNLVRDSKGRPRPHPLVRVRDSAS